ncbi:KpsF/GutQ family sugar-phosphate isomerase [Flavobacterium sp. MAH-1]|uniref:KpsF/GutQ family sugar-phosphate isomerase n=1 Tax=Flavobacterium agri TaxID=2743471 RepID=A0A7Y8Y1Z8_9FLAO|nr:KpsF/GutQ family sugar-phosphate isomerase [Flavobacterium agri]NUY80918.1 KpsF/GutQ family sugar-phosphate isomerase [Flavobacterium agri]NYA70942.1 KpsF/GutQ family sugar-phosphate isomerase [Flavobacterium agri]
MINTEKILASAKRTILAESEAIAHLSNILTEDFAKTAELILNASGRLVVTGIGKSAIIAQKIVATMNSTGTPAMFLHASEAIHGDLGMVQPGDVIICISKSGNSPEIKVLVPILKRFGNKLIGMTGNVTSFLAKGSDLVLDTTVAAEADPNNLAPTNSTTAQLVMGDALAVCLIEMRNFGAEDFAKYHPGGALGKKLLLRVGDMLDQTHRPVVSADSSIKNVIIEISQKRLGVTAVVENDHVIGIITDGDIRRMLEKRDSFTDLTAKDIMTQNPKMVSSVNMVTDALNTMEDFAITQLIVVDEGTYKGVIHLHDILKEGVV